MYLTQIMLANTVGINYIIADCQRMHTLVMSGFPSGDSETPRSDMAVLYDVEPTRSGVRVLIQSDIAPNIDAYRMYCARNTEPCVKNISALSEVLQNGMKLRFSVCANPTVQQSHTHGPRSARRFISDYDQRQRWLKRKLAEGGAGLNMAIETGSDTVRGKRKDAPLKFIGVRWAGVLTITDAKAFERLLRTGLGPERAYGMGMLTLQRY